MELARIHLVMHARMFASISGNRVARRSWGERKLPLESGELNRDRYPNCPGKRLYTYISDIVDCPS